MLGPLMRQHLTPGHLPSGGLPPRGLMALVLGPLIGTGPRRHRHHPGHAVVPALPVRVGGRRAHEGDRSQARRGDHREEQQIGMDEQARHGRTAGGGVHEAHPHEPAAGAPAGAGQDQLAGGRDDDGRRAPHEKILGEDCGQQEDETGPEHAAADEIDHPGDDAIAHRGGRGNGLAGRRRRGHWRFLLDAGRFANRRNERDRDLPERRRERGDRRATRRRGRERSEPMAGTMTSADSQIVPTAYDDGTP